MPSQHAKDEILLLSDAHEVGFLMQPYILHFAYNYIYFAEKNMENVFADLTRQYNGVETGFLLDPKTTGVSQWTM